ncbi:hypothetical protein T439DRAFT_85402 [Meredithblackwellia eburnea MCA 4105]
MKLDGLLSRVREEYEEVEKQVLPLLSHGDPEGGEVDFLRRKWSETTSTYDSTLSDSSLLTEELKEDKWLTVFRTVSLQAEEMMSSLEKVLRQCHEFVWDLERRTGGGETSGGGAKWGKEGIVNAVKGDKGKMQELLTTFVALHRSLHAKTKYYSPACSRVLKILGKGISDRSTKNGEVLRRFGEMKARWRNLLERITRIESEMKGVEEILKECKVGAEDVGGNGNGRGGKETDKGGESPFRRLANKVTKSPSTTSSPTATPTRSTGIPRQPSSNALATSPARPPRSEKRSPSSLGMNPTPSTTSTLSSSTSGPRSRPPLSSSAGAGMGMGHRQTQSVSNFLTSSSNATGLTPPRPTRRGPSPVPSDGGNTPKPRWNISTKRDENANARETLRETRSRPTVGQGTFTPTRSQGYGSSAGGGGAGGASGRHSSLGIRSTSRLSMARSINSSSARPASPAFSDASSSFVRERPFTPSRIPMPSSGSRIPSTSSSAVGRGFRSTTPFGNEEEGLRTTTTPTPTPSHTGNRPSPSSSTARRSSRSHLPVPTGALSPPRAGSPTPSSISQQSSFSYGYNFAHRGMTPEPSLIAQARRVSTVRMPTRGAAPPVPSIPAGLRSVSGTSTPMAATRRPTVNGSRPPSSLSRYNGVLSPTPGSISGGAGGGYQPYAPNPRDPLDVQIALVVNSLPILLLVDRVDPPLAAHTAIDGTGVGMSAKYSFSMAEEEGGAELGSGTGPVMCKLVDKVGPRAIKGAKKVLVRHRGGWQDLELWALDVLANSV